MTAIRVLTDHGELDNSGQVTHAQIDSYIQTTGWVVLSGSSGPLPPNARRLKQGPGIVFVDGGPGGDLEISAPGAAGAAISWNEVVSGDIDGVNLTFALSQVPAPTTSLMLFVNGVKQRQGTGNDYTLSGNTITMLSNYRSGSNIDATYQY